MQAVSSLMRYSLGPEQNFLHILVNSVRLQGGTSQSCLLPDPNDVCSCTALHRLGISARACSQGVHFLCRVPLPPIL